MKKYFKVMQIHSSCSSYSTDDEILYKEIFSEEAEREANREGVPPIELVDADKLIEMIERTELGVKPITTYEIDHEFFKLYM